MSLLFHFSVENMAVHEHYSDAFEQKSRHVQDAWGRDRSLLALHLFWAELSHLNSSAVTQTWKLCSSRTSNLENNQSLQRHIKAFFSLIPWLLPEQSSCGGVKQLMRNSNNNNKKKKRSWNYNRKGKCNSSRHDTNQPWKPICSFPWKALICTVLSCSGIKKKKKITVVLREWSNAFANEVGTSTARLNSVRSLTCTAYSDLKFLEWWL